MKVNSKQEIHKSTWRLVELIRSISGEDWNKEDPEDLEYYVGLWYSKIEGVYLVDKRTVTMDRDTFVARFSTAWRNWDDEKKDHLTAAAYRVLSIDWHSIPDLEQANMRFKRKKPERSTLLHLCFELSCNHEEGIFFLSAKKVEGFFNDFYGIKFSAVRAIDCLQAFREERHGFLELVEKGSAASKKANSYRWIFESFG